jgi:hypothetical protein
MPVSDLPVSLPDFFIKENGIDVNGVVSCDAFSDQVNWSAVVTDYKIQGEYIDIRIRKGQFNPANYLVRSGVGANEEERRRFKDEVVFTHLRITPDRFTQNFIEINGFRRMNFIRIKQYKNFKTLDGRDFHIELEKDIDVREDFPNLNIRNFFNQNVAHLFNCYGTGVSETCYPKSDKVEEIYQIYNNKFDKNYIESQYSRIFIAQNKFMDEIKVIR